MAQREIIEPVDLCDDRGRLNPDALGWTRAPLHRSNLRGWGRTKRWEHWGIVTPTHVLGLTVSSLDYAGAHGIYVLDRRSGEETRRDVVAPLARGTQLPELAAGGPVRARAGGLDISVDESLRGTRLHAEAQGVRVELMVERLEEHESLGVVVPWSERLFQYTHKDVARRVGGRIRLDGLEHPVPMEDSWAVLDHGRGRWPYAVTWNWGAGSGVVDGAVVGLQLGGGWTDGTGATENGIVVDGRLHHFDDLLDWQYDVRAPMRPWQVRGPHVDVVLEPFHQRVATTNLGVVASRTHQAFGHWRGHVVVDGHRQSVEGLVGWAEEARNRW
jgi:hypothetical protein